MLSYDVRVNANPLGRVSVAMRSTSELPSLDTTRDAYTVVWRGPAREGHGAAEMCLFRAPERGHVVRGAPILAFVSAIEGGAVVCVSNISMRSQGSQDSQDSQGSQGSAS
jgi:hypothetical protein